MATQSQIDNFLQRLARKLGGMAFSRATPAVGAASRQLQRAMELLEEPQPPGRARTLLFIPHYWAIYVHDGRGPFGPGSSATPPPKARVLVWFRNPGQDPRLINGLQVIRRNQVRRLTGQPAEAGPTSFWFWIRENQRARSEGRPEPMIVAKRHPGNLGKFFFSNKAGGGMSGFLSEARPVVKGMVREEMRRLLPKELFEQKTERITLRV